MSVVLNYYNIVFNIADFGLSKVMSSEVTMQTVCGTPGYVGEL